MEHAQALIVQAEFFLVRMEGSLDTVRRRSEEAFEKGASIKTCVRFFDTRGLVARAVMHAHVAQSRRKALLEILALSKEPAYAQEFGGLYQSAREEYSVRKSDLRRCVIRELRFTMQKDLRLALEQNDHSYRPMLVGEHAKLTKDIASASDCWVFLFPPNNLLADSHTDFLSVM